MSSSFILNNLLTNSFEIRNLNLENHTFFMPFMVNPPTHSTYAFHPGKSTAKHGGIMDKHGGIVDKHGGIMDKHGGVVDKLSGIRDKLGGTKLKKNRRNSMFMNIRTLEILNLFSASDLVLRIFRYTRLCSPAGTLYMHRDRYPRICEFLSMPFVCRFHVVSMLFVRAFWDHFSEKSPFPAQKHRKPAISLFFPQQPHTICI